MKVLVTEPILPSAIERLEQNFEVEVGKRGEYFEESALAKAAATFDGMLTMLSNPVTTEVLSSSVSLKVIANYAVGFNNIDLETAGKLGIRVANTPGVLTESTAEIALALLLGASRRTTEAEASIRNNQFDGWDPLGFVGMEIFGARLGIVGMGRIGMAFARRAAACGMEIFYHNRNRVEPWIEKELGATFVPDLHKMLPEIDALSLHCPLTSRTHHLIGREELDLLPEHAIVVNTARGEVIDEEALADALHNKVIAGAGLDVYEKEPSIHSRLLSAPGTLLLPHIGSATRRSRQAMADLATGAIISVLSGRPDETIPNLVTRSS
ncbi:MAG: D-glycerate dehydrogenase [Balneolaceae bacterium]